MDSLELNDSIWRPVTPSKKQAVLQWEDRAGVELSLHIEPADGDSQEENLAVIRQQKRDHYSERNLGLVQCDFETISDYKCLVSIAKVVAPLRGALYISEILVQHRAFSLVLLLTAQEEGETGGRETDVLAMQATKMEKTSEESLDHLIASMKRHPYFPDWEGASPWFESDAEEYDEQFPDHPLTKIRARTRSILEKTFISNDFFNYRARPKKRWWQFW